MEKRKRIIRRIAVIFTLALLLLTFFSNTIRNRLLPKVSTTSVYSGPVTDRITVMGSVEASSQNELKVSGTRVVKEVLASNGDAVKKGQVIATFDQEENQELKEAKDSLDDMERDYKKSKLKLSEDYTDDQVEIQNAEDDVAAAEKALANARQAEANLSAAKADLQKAKAARDSYVPVATASDAEMTKLERQVSEAEAAVTEYSSATSVDEAEKSLKLAKQAVDSKRRALSRKLQEAGLQAEADKLDAEASEKKIEDQKKAVKKKEDVDDSKAIKAPADGSLASFKIKKGDKLEAGIPFGRVKQDEEHYELKATITVEEASKIRQSDMVEVTNIWGRSVEVSIKDIKADTEEPNKKRVIIFDITGDVKDGETLELAIGGNGKSYEKVVANSAIKKDKSGKYVLTIRSKATPFGNRYILGKTYVQVLAKDTNFSAIEGDITPSNQVVTNASKPVEENQEVRLSEK